MSKKEKKKSIFCAQVPLIRVCSPSVLLHGALCGSFALDLSSGAVKIFEYFSSK